MSKLRMDDWLLKFWVIFALLFPEFAFASAKGGHLNFYQKAAEILGVEARFAPTFAALLALLITLAFGLMFKTSVEASLKSGSIAPAGKFNLRTAFEVIMSFLDELTFEQCGKLYGKFFPLLSAIFLFILISNLSGLVPGFPPFTESLSANLVIGLTVFVFYNIAGVAENGVGYLKQFTGPFLAMAPFFIVLEGISHLARPLSLSFRLTANIYVDHLLLSIFSGLVPLLVPAFLMFFGLLVAVIQSFVFTMLTGIYINMAISHDH